MVFNVVVFVWSISLLFKEKKAAEKKREQEEKLRREEEQRRKEEEQRRKEEETKVDQLASFLSGQHCDSNQGVEGALN